MPVFQAFSPLINNFLTWVSLNTPQATPPHWESRLASGLTTWILLLKSHTTPHFRFPGDFAISHSIRVPTDPCCHEQNTKVIQKNCYFTFAWYSFTEDWKPDSISISEEKQDYHHHPKSTERNVSQNNPLYPFLGFIPSVEVCLYSFGINATRIHPRSLTICKEKCSINF